MNNSKIFVLLIAVMLVVAVLIELSVPKRFSWKPSFDHASGEPFGSMLFDSLAAKSMGNGYSVKHVTFYQLAKGRAVAPMSVMDVCCENYYEMPKLEMKSLLSFVARGNKVLLGSNSFSEDLLDTLQLLMNDGYFFPSTFNSNAMSGLVRNYDTLQWGKDPVYGTRYYRVYDGIVDASFRLGRDTVYLAKDDEMVVCESEGADDSCKVEYADTVIKETSKEWKVMAWLLNDGEKLPVVVKRRWGRGEIVMCSTPLLLTNYGVMDGGNVSYVYRVLNSISGNPVVRLVSEEPEESVAAQSPMRFFLANPPLRWATYIALTTLLLFIIFTARRRQRAIPVVRKPVNHQLEFTKLIGTLYYQEGIHGDLVRKKYTFFAEQLRREVHVDVDDDAGDTENFNAISRHTGIDAADVAARIRTVRKACRGDMPMTEEEMMMYVDYMNEILYKI